MLAPILAEIEAACDELSNPFTHWRPIRWYQLPAKFQTLIDEWLTVKLPFAAFVPTFRGQRLPDATEIFPRQIRQRGFLIGDKPKGDFRLEIDWIRAYAKEKSKSSSSSANLRQPFEGRE